MRYAAFVLCSLVGFVIGHYLLSGSAAAYASVIISYHLYLGILIAVSEKRAGVSFPVVHSCLTHLAFLAVVVGLPYLRAQIPFFWVITLFVPALAPFEVNWLFTSETNGKEGSSKKKVAEVVPVEELLNAATAQDHEDFLEYMKQPIRTFRKTGRNVREEFAYWLAARAAKRAAEKSAAIETAQVSEAADA